MVTKRWSSLGVFLAGALSGAALIGSQWGSGASESKTSSADPQNTRETGQGAPTASFAEEPANVRHTRGNASVAMNAPAKPAGAEQQVKTDGAEATASEDGRALSDVLARLEAEYRRGAPVPSKREAPAPVDTARNAHSEERSSAAEATASNDLATRQPEPLQAAAPSVAVSNSKARLDAVPAARNVASLAAQGAAAVREPAQDLPENAFASSGHPQVTAQIQQLATLQQLAVAQQIALTQQLAGLQQLALLQQLQLLGPPPAPSSPPAFPVGSPFSRRVPRLGVVSVFSAGASSSHTPAGFAYAPTALVR